MNHPAQSPIEVYWTDGDEDTPVFQRPLEFEQLLTLYRELSPRNILEIGTYYGGTLKQWIMNAKSGAVVVSIDDYAIPGAAGVVKWNAWAEESAVILKLLHGSSYSIDIVEWVNEVGPYDWIFIDGSHLLADVERDWNNYGRNNDGVIVFHDILDHSAHPEIQVSILWKQIIDAGYRTEEIIEDHSAPWGGYGIVHVTGSIR